MASATIRRASLFAASLPLAEPFEHASSGRITTLEEVLLRLESDDGYVGWGEMRANNHYVTGETPGRLAAVMTEALMPRLPGLDAGSPRQVAAVAARSIVGNSTAKALVDVAMHDLAGRRAGVAAHVLLGGKRHESVHCHATLPYCEPEETARRAARYLEAGFDTIKLRLGLRPFERDLARLNAVRTVMQSYPAAILAADVNGGWSAKEALGNLRALRPYRLAWLEQPVVAGDFAGLRQVRRAAEFLIVADESCTGSAELLRLLAEDATDAFHFKLCKAGGMGALMAMVAIAEAAGRPFLIGQMDEGMLATAAAVQCGLATDALSYELWGYERVATQPFTGLTLRGAEMIPSAEPGLGVTVDVKALRLLATVEA